MKGTPTADQVSKINARVAIMSRGDIDIVLKRIDRNVEFNGMNMWDVIEICAIQQRIVDLDDEAIRAKNG